MLLGYGAKVCLRKMRVKAENRMVTTALAAVSVRKRRKWILHALEDNIVKF